MQITALYAGLLAPLFLLLSLRVIGQRRSAGVAVGHGEDKLLLRRMRVHANFAEYVPLVLVLMALAENLKTTPVMIHAVGILLIVGRLLHAYGVSQPKENLNIRVAGMAMTFTALGIGAALCLLGSFGFAVQL